MGNAALLLLFLARAMDHEENGSYAMHQMYLQSWKVWALVAAIIYDAEIYLSLMHIGSVTRRRNVYSMWSMHVYGGVGR